MKDKILNKIELLESQYAELDLTPDELELNKLGRQYDAQLNKLNAKKKQRDDLVKQINELNLALNVCSQFEEEGETE